MSKDHHEEEPKRHSQEALFHVPVSSAISEEIELQVRIRELAETWQPATKEESAVKSAIEQVIPLLAACMKAPCAHPKEIVFALEQNPSCFVESPTLLVRSLFCHVRQANTTKLVERTIYEEIGRVKISYRGPMLTQADLDLLLFIVASAIGARSATVCVSYHDIAKALGISWGSRTIETIRRRLENLAMCRVKIEMHHADDKSVDRYNGAFLFSYKEFGKAGRVEIIINPIICAIFVAGGWSLIDLAVRIRLKSYLAKWIYSYARSYLKEIEFGRFDRNEIPPISLYWAAKEIGIEPETQGARGSCASSAFRKLRSDVKKAVAELNAQQIPGWHFHFDAQKDMIFACFDESIGEHEPVLVPLIG